MQVVSKAGRKAAAAGEPAPSIVTQPPQPPAKTGTVEIADGPGVPAECHTCGHGCGIELGQFRVMHAQAEMLAAGKMECPKCGHHDVSKVNMSAVNRDRLDKSQLQGLLATKDKEIEQLRSQLEVAAYRNSKLQTVDPDDDLAEREPERGQHAAG